MKILLIEDTELIAELIVAGLESESHEINVAHNGSEGLHMFGETTYDAIICDYTMPGMDGVEVVQALRKISNIKIIAASSLYDYGKLMLDAGATSIFLKEPPFNWDNLNKLLQ